MSNKIVKTTKRDGTHRTFIDLTLGNDQDEKECEVLDFRVYKQTTRCDGLFWERYGDDQWWQLRDVCQHRDLRCGRNQERRDNGVSAYEEAYCWCESCREPAMCMCTWRSGGPKIATESAVVLMGILRRRFYRDMCTMIGRHVKATAYHAEWNETYERTGQQVNKKAKK